MTGMAEGFQSGGVLRSQALAPHFIPPGSNDGLKEEFGSIVTFICHIMDLTTDNRLIVHRGRRRSKKLSSLKRSHMWFMATFLHLSVDKRHEKL